MWLEHFLFKRISISENFIALRVPTSSHHLMQPTIYSVVVFLQSGSSVRVEVERGMFVVDDAVRCRRSSAARWMYVESCMPFPLLIYIYFSTLIIGNRLIVLSESLLYVAATILTVSVAEEVASPIYRHKLKHGGRFKDNRSKLSKLSV